MSSSRMSKEKLMLPREWLIISTLTPAVDIALRTSLPRPGLVGSCRPTTTRMVRPLSMVHSPRASSSGRAARRAASSWLVSETVISEVEIMSTTTS